MTITQVKEGATTHVLPTLPSFSPSPQTVNTVTRSEGGGLTTALFSDRAKRYARRTQHGAISVSAASTETAVPGQGTATENAMSFASSPTSLRSTGLANDELHDTANNKENIKPLSMRSRRNSDYEKKKPKPAEGCGRVVIQPQGEETNGNALSDEISQPSGLVTLRSVSFWGDVTHGLTYDADPDTETEDDFAFEELDWVTKRMEPVKFWGARGQLSDYVFPVPCVSNEDNADEDAESTSPDMSA